MEPVAPTVQTRIEPAATVAARRAREPAAPARRQTPSTVGGSRATSTSASWL